MICPQCKADGVTSQVYPGTTMTTCVYYHPYYDEHGNYHNHDGNRSRTEYRCSRGHTWTEANYRRCWCGWTNEPPTNGER